MYTYRVGGKSGRTYTLVESPNHVVVRTRRSMTAKESPFSEETMQTMDRLMPVTLIPEANVTVYECIDPQGNNQQLRDVARAQLKTEPEVRFAGRALKDSTSQQLFLYTENFFVKFHEGIHQKECLELLTEHNMQVKSALDFAGNAYFAEAAEGTGFAIFAMAELLLDRPETEYCHPELVQQRRFKSVGKNQWHLYDVQTSSGTINQHVQALEAWKHTRGKGITIAVIDDGIDISHPEFQGAGKVVHPYDAFLDSDDPSPRHDSENHGTPCAGIACANGEHGASGVAPDAALLPIRAGNLGSMSEAKAFKWAADRGADIISCSWGPADGTWHDPNDPRHTAFSPLFDSTRLAIEYALRKGRNGLGCLIFWAAGNGGEDADLDGYAANPLVFAVAACNLHGRRSHYSDYGTSIACCFPSNDYSIEDQAYPQPVEPGIWTTDRTGRAGYNSGGTFTPPHVGDPYGLFIAQFGGTSGACPGAAGAAGLMLATNNHLTHREVRSLLALCCDRIDLNHGRYDHRGHSIYYGFGRINALKSVLVLPQDGDPGKVPVVCGLFHYSTGDFDSTDQRAPANMTQRYRRIIGAELIVLSRSHALQIEYTFCINEVPDWSVAADGNFAGAKDRRRKCIGFRARLKGDDSSRFSLKYSVEFNQSRTHNTQGDGIWCGQNAGAGAAITGIRIRIEDH